MTTNQIKSQIYKIQDAINYFYNNIEFFEFSFYVKNGIIQITKLQDSFLDLLSAQDKEKVINNLTKKRYRKKEISKQEAIKFFDQAEALFKSNRKKSRTRRQANNAKFILPNPGTQFILPNPPFTQSNTMNLLKRPIQENSASPFI